VVYRRVLVLGGARSGKSVFAERLATEMGAPVVYVATARAVDQEMSERIAHHRARRPPSWTTVEVATDVATQVLAEVGTILVEDLTLLLSNHMERDTASAESHTVRELEALVVLETDVILVSNEVGMGLVPDTALGRLFRDALGRVNQAAASMCTEAYVVVAGLPWRLK
jgi:adenosyl cobinamide kinase/adenosyl cobinamide phosphate guanylyltransferase